IGGTVGDIESLPFLEAIRQIKSDIGRENVMYIHCTLVPYIKAAVEMKTKPTQHSVKELRSLGINPDALVLRKEYPTMKYNKNIRNKYNININYNKVTNNKSKKKIKTKQKQHSDKELRSLDIQPDAIVLRTEYPVEQDNKNKIAEFCDTDKRAVIEMLDADTLYQVPIALQEQGLDKLACEHLHLDCEDADMVEWEKLVNRVRNLSKTITIGLVGKYVELPDAYLSIVESLKHAGFTYDTDVKIRWINSQKLNAEEIQAELKDVDGIMIPSGFGTRGIEGKITAIQYARENKIQ